MYPSASKHRPVYKAISNPFTLPDSNNVFSVNPTASQALTIPLSSGDNTIITASTQSWTITCADAGHTVQVLLDVHSRIITLAAGDSLLMTPVIGASLEISNARAPGSVAHSHRTVVRAYGWAVPKSVSASAAAPVIAHGKLPLANFRVLPALAATTLTVPLGEGATPRPFHLGTWLLEITGSNSGGCATTFANAGVPVQCIKRGSNATYGPTAAYSVTPNVVTVSNNSMVRITSLPSCIIVTTV